MTVRAYVAVTAAVLLAACVHRRPAVSAVTTGACPHGDVGTPDHPWREIHGESFSFCMPTDWYPDDGRTDADARAWRQGSMVVSWSPGPSQRQSDDVANMVSIDTSWGMSAEAVRRCGASRNTVVAAQRARVTWCPVGAREQESTTYFLEQGIQFRVLSVQGAGSQQARIAEAILGTIRFEPERRPVQP